MPLSSTTLADPIPPFNAAAWAPVPAPIVPWRTASTARRRRSSMSERRVGPVIEGACAEVEDHGGGHDRHDPPGVAADLEAAALLLQPRHHPDAASRP